MANVRWEGKAQAIAQVDTVTIALTWAQNDTITLTINTKSIVVTIGTLTSTAQVATTLKEAWEGETLTDTSASVSPSGGKSDISEHNEITATVSGSVVSFTHDTAGVPYTMTVTEATAGDGTATEATATSATGPNFWSNADNWDTGSVPVSTDDVYFDNSAVSVLYGLDQSAVTLTSLTIARSYTGEIGLPKQNAAGYVEYRDDYLQISATTITIGRGDGTGSPRMKIDCGSVATTVNVESTGTSIETGIEALLWKGTNVANVIDVQDGDVGIAIHGGEAANLATLRCNTGNIRCGDGVVFAGGATVDNEAATLALFSDVTTINTFSGQTTVGGTADVTTLTINGGTVFYDSNGTVTTLTVGGTGINSVLDCSRDNRAMTVTNGTIELNGDIIDPQRRVTYSNNLVRGTSVRQLTAR